MNRPLIGINCDVEEHASSARVVARSYLDTARMIDRNGGDPVLLAPLAAAGDSTRDYLERLLARLDGLVLVGGADIPNEALGAVPHPACSPMHAVRYEFDKSLLAAALERRKPLLGICLGCQQLNVALGGTLVVHIPDRYGDGVCHRDPEPSNWAEHRVELEAGSRLADLLGQTGLDVRGRHHQSVDRPGRGLEVVARAPDGVTEALEDPGHPFLVGVQWHPEIMADAPPQHRLFAALVRVAAQTGKEGS